MKPLIFTIFGATGDLTFRKLIPALFTLYSKSLLSENFTIIGFARRDWSDENFWDHLTQNVTRNHGEEALWESFLTHIKYVASEFTEQSGYFKLAEIISNIQKINPNSYKTEEFIKVFYLSTSPEFFKEIAENINNSPIKDLCLDNANSRVVVEKPYGTDLKNAVDVDNLLKELFLQEHIYRIDHYLGKESVQNILVFRFANSIFERVWNNEHIDHIQIKADEALGVEERGGYYDETGAMKDMIPNHVLQMIALVTMDAPSNIAGDDIQKRRLEILKNIFIQKENDQLQVIRGQYEGYKEEKNVNANSKTETFVAMKLGIDNDKWRNVPIYIRTGKKMRKKVFEISIKFKDRDLNIYDKLTGNVNDVITFRINPDEGISITMMAKEPSLAGGKVKIVPVSLDFCYRPTFNAPILDAYVGLVQNIIFGDQSLFTSVEEVEEQWKFIKEKIKGVYDVPVIEYKVGDNGPVESNELLRHDGREWISNDHYVCAIR